MRAGRISNLAPPGSLLKQPRAIKRKPKVTRAPQELDGAHLEAVRACPCLKCGIDQARVAAHVRMASAAHGKPNPGMRTKPDDKWALPLCRECHEEQHRVGELSFWHDLGINPVLVCLKLYQVSPNVEAMRAMCFATQAIGAET